MASAPPQQRPPPPEKSPSPAPISNQKEAASTAHSAIQGAQEGVFAVEAKFPRVLENGGSEQHLNPSFVPPSRDQSENEVEQRHCWICLQDEGEDDSDSTEWRSPCKCKLQAHEECLLEWIADLETPKRDDPDPVEVRCPQCRSKIQVARPRDYIVLVVDALRDIIELLRVPAQISAAVGLLVSSSLVYGLNAVQLVFGTEDARRLLMVGSIERDSSGVLRQYGSGWLLDRLFGAMLYSDPLLPSNSLVGWGSFAFALPLIAPVLILSRTRLADSISILLPLPYFLHGLEYRSFKQWPQGPGLIFAALPYVRFAYFKLYRHLFADLEKQWDQALLRKPREGETIDQLAQEQQRNRQGREDVIMDLEFVVHGEEEHHVAPNAPQAPVQDQVDRAEGNGPNRDAMRQPAPNGAQLEAQAGQQPAQQNAQPGHAVEWRQDISVNQVATSVMGALFLPAISSLMGDLLRVSLPRAWVRKPSQHILPFMRQSNSHFTVGIRGLLQEKWGRSVVGGCLFIVLKDALILYCKWRKAHIQQKRRVLDYVDKGSGA